MTSTMPHAKEPRLDGPGPTIASAAMDDQWDITTDDGASSSVLNDDQQELNSNATSEIINDEPALETAALDASNSLEAIAAASDSLLPSLPEHRLAASTFLLVLLVLLMVALLALAVRRPMLRRALSRRSSNEIEWTPVNRRASYEPQPILPPTPGGVPQPQYNTFGDDGDAAWQAAKQDWYAAIAAAKKLHEPGGADGVAGPSSSTGPNG